MNEVLLIGGMAAVTFAIRYPVLALLGRIELPKPALRALRYVPVAVLMAIIVPAVLIPNGDRIWVGIGNNSLIAGTGRHSGIMAHKEPAAHYRDRDGRPVSLAMVVPCLINRQESKETGTMPVSFC